LLKYQCIANIVKCKNHIGKSLDQTKIDKIEYIVYIISLISDMLYSTKDMSLVLYFKTSRMEKKNKDKSKKELDNYRKFLLSGGSKMSHYKDLIRADPYISYIPRTKQLWGNVEDDSYSTNELNRFDYNHLPSNFKRKDDNIKGWVQLKCGCHWGRHPNGARRGNTSRKQQFHKPKKISIDLE
jgi:hypothetical protein